MSAVVSAPWLRSIRAATLETLADAGFASWLSCLRREHPRVTGASLVGLVSAEVAKPSMVAYKFLGGSLHPVLPFSALRARGWGACADIAVVCLAAAVAEKLEADTSFLVESPAHRPDYSHARVLVRTGGAGLVLDGFARWALPRRGQVDFAVPLVDLLRDAPTTMRRLRPTTLAAASRGQA